ncbi:MAG TPA: choice-of-anchor D domain-containing protein [Candidatus Limnocylindrales bacterium]
MSRNRGVRLVTLLIASIVILVGAASPAAAASKARVSTLSQPVNGLYADGPGWPGSGAPFNASASATYSASVSPQDPSVLQITVNASSTWSFVFASAPGTTLSTGNYTNAVRASFRGPGQNGVDLSVGSTGCSTFSGSFTVLELEKDGGGAISAAAVDYEIHCESQTPAVAGSVRFQSLIGYRAIAIDPFPVPPPLGVASEVVGYPAPDSAITVESTGTDPLTISSVNLTGSSDFDITSQDCTAAALPGGGPCAIHIGFTPSAIGLRSASLSIADNARAGGHGFGLAGQGLLAGVTPSALDLGTQEIYTWGNPQTITVRNGPNTLGITDLRLYSARTDFALAGVTCGASVTPGATCTIKVRFRPTIVGPQTASVIVYTSDAGNIGTNITATGQKGTAITWGSTRSLAYRWNSGNGLARSTSSTASYLHTIESSNRVGSHLVTDSGPYEPILYARSSNGGATWSTAVRLNPTTQHGDRPAIAAYGSYVYATWVKIGHAVHYSHTAPRVIYVRVNHSYGSGTWGTIHRITSLTGRVDFPVIAVYGASVYLVWTDAVTGSIRIAISRDRGATWHTTTLGSTTSGTADGKGGYPVVAVSGSRIIVAWRSNSSGAIRVRTSTTSGSSWAAAVTVSSASNSYPAVAARGTRFAVSWTTTAGAHVRVANGTTWGVDASVGPPGSSTSYVWSSGPAVALQGTGGVALAWSACVRDCSSQLGARYDLIWAESGSNGATWARQVVGWSETTGGQIKILPSIVWAAPTLRYVEWNGINPEVGAFGLFLRAGSGVP